MERFYSRRFTNGVDQTGRGDHPSAPRLNLRCRAVAPAHIAPSRAGVSKHRGAEASCLVPDGRVPRRVFFPRQGRRGPPPRCLRRPAAPVGWHKVYCAEEKAQQQRQQQTGMLLLGVCQMLRGSLGGRRKTLWKWGACAVNGSPRLRGIMLRVRAVIAWAAKGYGCEKGLVSRLAALAKGMAAPRPRAGQKGGYVVTGGSVYTGGCFAVTSDAARRSGPAAAGRGRGQVCQSGDPCRKVQACCWVCVAICMGLRVEGWEKGLGQNVGIGPLQALLAGGGLLPQLFV